MPSDVAFRVVRKLLEDHGWTNDRIRGSHHHFKCEGRPSITIPVHQQKVKHVYLREVQKLIKAHEGGASPSV